MRLLERNNAGEFSLADVKEIPARFEGAIEKSVWAPLHALHDTDQTMSDERSRHKVIDVERYRDLFLGQFPEDQVASPVRSKRRTNPEFEKQLDDIERAVVHEGFNIGNKYILDQRGIDYARSKVIPLHYRRLEINMLTISTIRLSRRP